MESRTVGRAEGREEEKVRLREFVVKYLALCEEYAAEVTVNSYGVHCVESDSGRSFPFKTVYPEWGDLAEQEES